MSPGLVPELPRRPQEGAAEVRGAAQGGAGRLGGWGFHKSGTPMVGLLSSGERRERFGAIRSDWGIHIPYEMGQTKEALRVSQSSNSL